MSWRYWLASPLTGTLGVLAGLGLLAVPLHRLTSREPVSATRSSAIADETAGIPAVLRVRLLKPARRLVLKTDAGGVLVDQADLAAGETEFDLLLPLRDNVLEVVLNADLGADETAVFLTILPDGHGQRTCYVIGNGEVEELLRYDWHTH